MSLAQKFCQFTRDDNARSVRVSKGYNEDQPRDERGRWSAADRSEARTLLAAHDRIKNDPVRNYSGRDPGQVRSLAVQQQPKLTNLHSQITELAAGRKLSDPYSKDLLAESKEHLKEASEYMRQGNHQDAIYRQDAALSLMHRGLEQASGKGRWGNR